jgi:hypothetical protein
MSILKLLDILRALGSEPSALEVADALWWMLRTEHTDLPAEKSSGSTGMEGNKDKPQAMKEQIGGDSLEPERRSQPTDPTEAKDRNDIPRFRSPFEPRVVVPEPVSQPAKTAPQGLPLTTPAVNPLPDGLNIARALRPLRRRVPLSNGFVLDEEATAHRSAEEHMLVPILRRLRTRWLAVDVVVDESDSMVIWRSTVLEFVRLLARQGAFRDVRVWGLDPSSWDTKQLPRLHAELRRGGMVGNIHNPSELVDVGGRRLVLIVSDCIAPGWHSGAVAQMMGLWARTNPMAIIQMLPRWLWERSSLGREIGIELYSPYPGAPNTQLIVRPSDERLDDDEEVPPGVPTPVLSLDHEEVRSWANYIVSTPRTWTRGVQLSTLLRKPQTRDRQDADVLLRRFYANASPPAQALAEHLAAAPLTLPVINLVQQIMDKTKHPSQAYTAEVLLGGLVRRETNLDQYVSPDEILYEFLPGVREQLLARLERKKLRSVIERISEYIEQASQLRQMRSGLIGLPKAGQIPVVEALPFAKIRALLLRSMGYTRLAEWLEREVQAQATVSMLLHSDPGESPRYRLIEACRRAREYCLAAQNQLEEEIKQQNERYEITENNRLRRRESGAPPSDISLIELERQLIILGEQIGTFTQMLKTLREIYSLVERDERYDEIEQRCGELSAQLQAPIDEPIKHISSVLLQALDDTIAEAAARVDISWIEADDLIVNYVFSRYPAYKPADVQRHEWAVKAFGKALEQDDRYDDLAREIADIQRAYWANQEVRARANALFVEDVRDSSWAMQAKHILERLDGLRDTPEIQYKLPFDVTTRLQRRDVLALRLFIYQLNYQGFRTLLADITLPSTIVEELMLEQEMVETVEQAADYYRNQEWEDAILALRGVSGPYAETERATTLQRAVIKNRQDEQKIKKNLDKIEIQLQNSDIASDSSISLDEVLRNLDDIQLQIPPDGEGSGVMRYRARYADLRRLYAQRWQERAEHLLRIWGGPRLPVARQWFVEVFRVHAGAVPMPASDLHGRLATMLQGWAKIAEALLIIEEAREINRADELLQSGAALLTQTAPEGKQISTQHLLDDAFARVAKQRAYILHLKQDARKAHAEKRLDKAREIWDRALRLDPDDKEARNERLALLTEIRQRQQEARKAHDLQERALREAIRLWREVEATYIDGQYPADAPIRMPLKRWLQQAERIMQEGEQQIAKLCPETQRLCTLIMLVTGSPPEQSARWDDVMVQVQVIERHMEAVRSGMQSEIPTIYRDILIQIKEYILSHRELLHYLSATPSHKDAYTLIADLKNKRANIQKLDRDYQNNKHTCDLDLIDEVIIPSWKQVEEIALFLGIKA